MRPVSRLKRIDETIVSLLIIFLAFSFLFRVSSVSIMNPGFPVLRQSIWSCFMPDGCEPPVRNTNVYDFNKVSYKSFFDITDNSQAKTTFSVLHTVTRFSNTAEAMAAFQTNYEIYRSKNVYELVTNIPGLDFTSKANKYYLWCEYISNPAIVVKVDTCYYWSVYGRFYSELRVSVAEGHGQTPFSIDVFNDYLNRTDHKLSTAQRWFK